MVFIMHPGHYHQQQPQMHGLPMGFQYSDDTDSGQSSHLLSCDGLPRITQPTSSQFMTANPTSTANILPSSFNLVNPMAMSQSSITWTDPNQAPPAFDDQTAGDYYNYSPTTTGNENSNPFLSGMERMNFQIPRWVPDHMRMYNNDVSMDSYGANTSMYMMESQRADLTRPLGYSLDHSRDFARLSISPGPKIEDSHDGLLYDKPTAFMSGMPSSETSDDGGNSSREVTAAVDVEDQASGDEPYAKLIYRALMSKPDHAMILQEIYQWFRDNTSKGSSDSKGWMNSIRHNLSMNAAFKKTERKIPGDDTKKSTEWVLEEFAVKDGVQSTTRYRTKTTSAYKKFPKSDTPSSGRHSSSRKTSLYTTKYKTQRRGGSMREGGLEPKRSMSRMNGIDPARRQEFESITRSQIHSQRQRSPLTPPNTRMENMSISSSGPYFFPKAEQPETPYEVYGLEDVQGVYVDDGGPLFTHPEDPPFADHSMSNHGY